MGEVGGMEVVGMGERDLAEGGKVEGGRGGLEGKG